MTLAPVRRVLAALTQLALLLPFCSFADCHGQGRVELTGLELYGSEVSLLLLPGTLVAIALLFRPMPTRWVAPMEGLGAVGAALGLGGTFLAVLWAPEWAPSLALQVGIPSPMAGFVVAETAWSFLWLAALGAAFMSLRGPQDPEGTADRTLVVLSFAPFLLLGIAGFVDVELAEEPSGWIPPPDLLLIVFVLFVLPFLPAGIGRTRVERHRPWGYLGLAFALAGATVLAAQASLGFLMVGSAFAIYALVRALKGGSGNTTSLNPTGPPGM